MSGLAKQITGGREQTFRAKGAGKVDPVVGTGLLVIQQSEGLCGKGG